MPSNLTYTSTDSFRKALISRNLKPYTIPGYYTPNAGNVTYEVTLRDIVVTDTSADDILNRDPYADILYPLNAYGPSGGYNKNTKINGLANTKSNLGPYDYSDANLTNLSLPIEKKLPTKNIYSSGNGIQLYSISDALFNSNPNAKSVFKPYFDPWSFIPSTYSAYSILLQTNPAGDYGTLSQDSFIVKLGASQLKTILTNTNSRGTLNNLNNKNASNSNGINAGATDLLRGNSNFFSTTFKITTNTDPTVINDNFINRLSGNYIPTSPIPGDYFQDELFTRYPASTAQLTSAVGLGTVVGSLNQYFGPKVIRQKSPSEVFLLNTGSGQASQLFRNIDYNKYKPNYKRSALQDISQGVLNVLGVSSDIHVPSNYYVGSSVQDPKYVNSPLGEVPFDSFGRDTQAIVYGPDKMGGLFENTQTNRLKFGLNGTALADGAGLSGGLVWTSPKYNNPGYQARIGGDQGTPSPSSSLTNSQIGSDLSSNKTFKTDSILDNTQKILDSTPRGGKRLSHVGNAINQLSKVFNDGYKEITKGSKVLTYTDVNGIKRGTEYGRVFTKDSPYFTYANLQKTGGNNRKFTYSVLDNTYNLNITPSSTSVVNNQVKKYMFSIENLAWRTSNTPNLSVADLPNCEKGPNGGRIMWFPPYDIVFTENSKPLFNPTTFLGRPEPIYTYSHTSRSGTLSWKIIVDHPSILNLIVDKDLKGFTDTQINSIVDSFMAGCTNYDLYTLAQKYPTIPNSEIELYQKLINEANLTNEAAQAIATSVNKPQGNTPNTSKIDLSDYQNYSFYFNGNVSDPNQSTTQSDYQSDYNSYIASKSTYLANNPNNQAEINTFFDNVIPNNFSLINRMLSDILSNFTSNTNPDGSSSATITLNLVGTDTSASSIGYQNDVTLNRIESIKTYISNWNSGVLSKYIDSKNLNIIKSTENPQTIVSPIGAGTPALEFDCTNLITNNYSAQVMACSRVSIYLIDYRVNAVAAPANCNVNSNNPNSTNKKTPNDIPQLRDNITKKLLRSILTECNYFNYIKESDPIFYNSMQDKIKHFNPAFHSMTPEGLNSRLTFLQQCMRPGDTIPIVNNNGITFNDNVKNTSFGAPPVLVLRIGDFYNTKIIPENLSIQYEPLVFDMNPEGIGVQPMIAKISLTFNFIGGSGLKEPISKLQNALSFNYYGNTEMYDERADETDNSLQVNNYFDINEIVNNSLTVCTNNETRQPVSGGSPLGTQQSIEIPGATSAFQPATPLFLSLAPTSNTGVSGTTSYQNLMDSLLDNGQNYMSTIYSNIQQITRDYNFQVYTLFTQDRNYVDGKTNEYSVYNQLKIFGKPYNIDNNFVELVTRINSDIDNVNSKNDDGLNYIRLLYAKNYPKTAIKKIKSNLKNVISSNMLKTINYLNLTSNDMTNSQQSLITTFRKIDFIGYYTDGYMTTSLSPRIYNLTATTEVQQPTTATNTYEEMITNDYALASNQLMDFYSNLQNNNLIDVIFDYNNIPEYSTIFSNYSCCKEPEKRFFTAMSNVILNNNLFISFISDIMTSDVVNLKSGGQTIGEFTNEYFKIKKLEYKVEYDAEQNYAVLFKQNTSYINTFKVWTPYVKGKIRKFLFSDYTPGDICQINILTDIYKNGNSNTQLTTFNGKNVLN